MSVDIHLVMWRVGAGESGIRRAGALLPLSRPLLRRRPAEAVHFFRQLVDHHSSAFRPMLAKALLRLAANLAALSRLDEARAAAEEAVGIRRMIVQDRTTGYLEPAELARALDQLAAILARSGSLAEASAARDSADGIRRDLAAEGLHTEQDDTFEVILVELHDGQLSITTQW